MPELPEVETVGMGIRDALIHQKLKRVDVYRPAIRFPLPPNMDDVLSGQILHAVKRRSKYLTLHFDKGSVVIIHLGMSGQIIIESGNTPDAPEKHDHVIFHFDTHRMRYRDPRRFGVIDVTSDPALGEHRLLKDIGPEPLEDGFTADGFYRALKKSQSPLKTLLLDQHIVAGVGNIYASEALYRAGLHPSKSGNRITKAQAVRLHGAVRATLQDAITAGGSSLRDYVQTDGSLGYFQHHFKVYGRAGLACPDCTCDIEKTKGIEKIVQSGRSSFYCPRRQK